jgi:hypothetical protein
MAALIHQRLWRFVLLADMHQLSVKVILSEMDAESTFPVFNVNHVNLL